MIKEQYKYSDITAKIIGCAMKVHSVLGNGFQEVIYQRALAIEFRKARLEFVRELEMPVFYDSEEIGMLINLGAKSLQFKRLINSKFKSEPLI